MGAVMGMKMNWGVMMQKRVNVAGIAELLGYSRCHVRDVITKRPDFPKPVINITQKNRWWAESDVLEWVRVVSQAA